MHDLDRTQLEFESEEPEGGFEGEDFEFDFGESGSQMESPFSDEEEMELASQLLEVSDEAELDQFLGGLIKKAARAAGGFIKSPVGRALGGILRSAARKALPVVGGALGTFVGGPAGGMLGSKLASMAGKTFGLELEGLSPEDQEFEVARRFVRFSGSAAQKAATAQPTAPPNITAKNAVIEAAKLHAPGLIRPPVGPTGYTPGRGRQYGRWQRHGRKIVIYGAY